MITIMMKLMMNIDADDNYYSTEEGGKGKGIMYTQITALKP